jgi:hypothetical protein
VLDRIKEAEMLINISKSTFCQKELEFLGFIVSPTEVKMSPR